MGKFLQKVFIGCATFIGIGVTGIVLFLIIWIWNNEQKEQEIVENIVIEIDSPLNVNQGEEFTINVYITNKSEKEYKLSDIDVPPEYFKGIDIFEANPPFNDKFIGFATGDQSYKFNTIIPPQQSTKISLSAFAETPGDYRSLIDICLDSSSSCIGSTIRTKVSNDNN